MNNNRRGIQPLKSAAATLLILSGAVLFVPTPLALHAATALTATPVDQEGPFYPVTRRQDEDNDLLQVAGRSQRASGNILYLSGTVRDTMGVPLNNHTVEIWQTDPQGRYLDNRDRSPGPRDPDFQYWGKAATDADGRYFFTTLLPGEYSSRPPHIHFKVWAAGTVELTSQIYFSNHPDAIKKGYRFRTDDQLTVDLNEVEANRYEAHFDIVLKPAP